MTILLRWSVNWYSLSGWQSVMGARLIGWLQ